MAKLTTRLRKTLTDSQFGLPKQRKYPMPDASHAANAKARAAQMRKRGLLSKLAEIRILRKANRILKNKDRTMVG